MQNNQRIKIWQDIIKPIIGFLFFWLTFTILFFCSLLFITYSINTWINNVNELAESRANFKQTIVKVFYLCIEFLWHFFDIHYFILLFIGIILLIICVILLVYWSDKKAREYDKIMFEKAWLAPQEEPVVIPWVTVRYNPISKKNSQKNKKELLKIAKIEKKKIYNPEEYSVTSSENLEKWFKETSKEVIDQKRITNARRKELNIVWPKFRKEEYAIEIELRTLRANEQKDPEREKALFAKKAQNEIELEKPYFLFKEQQAILKSLMKKKAAIKKEYRSRLPQRIPKKPKHFFL